MLLPPSTGLPARCLCLLPLLRGARRPHTPPPTTAPSRAAAPRARALSISAPRPRKTPAPEAREPGPDDPLDLEPLQDAFRAAGAKFRPQLLAVGRDGHSDLAGGVGALPVLVKAEQRGGGGDAAPQAFPLRDLAQVVPRPGRVVSLLVHDLAYVKPIMSAVQGSPDFNQQPQRSPDNEFELLLRHEPSRPDELLRRIKDVGQAWREAVRHHRTRHDKLLKEGRRAGAVLPDVLRKAEKEVQKLQDNEMKAIEADEASVVKQLQRK